MDSESKKIIERCIEVFGASSSENEAIKQIATEYGLAAEDLLVNEEGLVRDAAKITDEGLADRICESAVFGNNATAISSFFSKIQDEIFSFNIDLADTSITKSTQEVSRNPRLHGFLYEQLHVSSFNLKAKLEGKPYVARVLKPMDGKTYAKNSVDIIIRDIEKGKDVHRYQAKCCKDSASTISAIKEGDYSNQRLLVPDGQVAEVKREFPSKTVTSCIQYDGVASNSFSYQEAKKLQFAIQNNNFENVDWSVISTRDIAMAGIQSLKTPVMVDALLRLTCGVSDKMLANQDKTWGEIGTDVVKGVSLDTIKMALTVAVKVLIEKHQFPETFKNLPNMAIYSAVHVCVDTVIEVAKCAEGKQSLDITIENVTRNFVSTAVQCLGTLGGETLGGAVGSFFGPVGTAIGRVTGGVLGSVVSSECVDKVWDVVKNMCQDFVNELNNVKNQLEKPVKNKQKQVAFEGGIV